MTFGVLLLHGRLQFQGIQLHDGRDLCVRANELALLNQALRNGSAGGSSNRRIGHFLFCEFIAGTAILQAGLQRADILQSRLHSGLGDLEAGVVGIEIGSREQALVDQFLSLGQLDAGVVAIGNGGSDRGNLFVGRYDAGRALSMPS